VVNALEQATAAVRAAVDAERARSSDDAGLRARENQLHEVRSLLSTVALMIRAFKLPELAGHVSWQETAERDCDVRPDKQLHLADDDLWLAQKSLTTAATHLTAARRRLADLQ
jgi:hypothetical protein